MSINSVNLSGNLTRDPVLRSTSRGTSVLELGIAVNDHRKDANGEWVDVPCYVDCTMFGSRAESVSRYLTKGSKIAIKGKLNYSSWQDKNTGKNRSKLDVVIDDIEFMSQANTAAQPAYQLQQYQAAPQQYGAPAPRPVQAAPQPMQAAQPIQQPVQQPVQPNITVYDEDIPF